MSIVDPNEYKKQLKMLNDRYYLILDELITVYPKYKMKPEDSMYSDTYITDKGNLTKLQKDLFLYKNNLEQTMKTVGEDILVVDKQIMQLEKENSFFKKRLDSLKEGQNASKLLLKNTVYLHNEDLVANLLLGLVFMGSAYGCYKHNKTQA